MNINMYQNLLYLAGEYNRRSGVPSSRKVDLQDLRRQQYSMNVEMPCKVAFVGDNSYGKFQKDLASSQVVMEYSTFLAHLSEYLPKTLNDNPTFKAWIKSDGEQALVYTMSDYIMMTLPNPRVDYYQSSDYYEI